MGKNMLEFILLFLFSLPIMQADRYQEFDTKLLEK